MNAFPRYFAFGDRYAPGDDYVRCDRPERSVVVAPGVGEALAGDELSLERCLTFVTQGILSETNEETVGCKPSLVLSDRRQAAGTAIRRPGV
jgi:hypothetical protein